MKTYTAPPLEWDCGILLSNIHKNGAPYVETFELPLDGPIEYWGSSYKVVEPVHATVDANYAGENIVVHVIAGGEFSLPCSRCLEETGLAISGEMRYLFSLRHPVSEASKKRRRDDEEDEPADEPDGDVDVIRIDGFQTELDLCPYIWETVILNLPERVLCREDCRGLCPICGGNKNLNDCGCKIEDTDPRLEVLRDLN